MVIMRQVEVSVIVPCYNVEDYVDACAKSLLAQGAENYEIVFVDDGSTDATGAKLEAYRNDPRVTVVHRTNGGLSAARNSGVAVARGRYVVFVDGDDFVSPCFVSALVRGMDEADGRIVVGSLLPISQGDVARGIAWEVPSFGATLSQEEAFDYLCRDVITESSCAKLFPRSLFGEVSFPEGHLYEDLFVIGDCLERVSEVVLLDKPIYAYVMRPSSIVHSVSVPLGRAQDYMRALSHLAGIVAKRCPQCSDSLLYRRLLTYARLRPLLKSVEDDPARARELMREHASFSRRLTGKIVSSDKMTGMSKLRFLLFGWMPPVYDGVMSLYERRVKGLGGGGGA